MIPEKQTTRSKCIFGFCSFIHFYIKIINQSDSLSYSLSSLLHFRPSPRDVCHGGQGEGIMTGGFLFVCVLYVNETRASEVSLCPEAACMFLFYFIFKYVTVVYSKQQECSRTAVVGVTEEKVEAGGELTFSENHDKEEQQSPAERREC